MSREVIDDVPSDAGPPGPEPAAGLVVADLSSDLSSDPSSGPSSGPSSDPAHDPAHDPAREPSARARVVPAGPGAAPADGRRPVPLWSLVVAAGLALLLGLAAGSAQGRSGERTDRAQATRVFVTPAGSMYLRGDRRVGADLRALSTGGDVLLSELRTPFGTVPIEPPVELVTGRTATFPVDVVADCTNFRSYQDGDSARVLTGTALVRDRPGADPRPVALDFSPQLWGVLYYGPCGTDPTVASEQTPPDPGAATPTVSVVAMTAGDDGSLTMDLRLVTDLPSGQLLVDLAVAPSLLGSTPGHFEVSRVDLPTAVSRQDEQVRGTLRLTYHCRPGTQELPALAEIVRPDLTAADGRPAEAAGIAVPGWDGTVAARAVRAAMARAGCPAND